MKKILFTAILLMTSLTIAAQTPDEVTLTVSGSGRNEEKATLVALRSAIEQTYGTFVSANTDILNDELVKDEIVSISAGNIKKFTKLSSIVLRNGQVSVTLSATVSIGKLVNYAQSKGATTEFAGATLAMNVKLMELREKNTLEALCNMWQTVSELSKKAFDYKIETGQPKIEKNGYLIPIVVTAMANEYTSKIEELVKNTYQSLRLTKSEHSEWEKLGRHTYGHPFPLTNKENINKYLDEKKKADQNIYYSLLNFVIEENSGEDVSYVVRLGKKNKVYENDHDNYKIYDIKISDRVPYIVKYRDEFKDHKDENRLYSYEYGKRYKLKHFDSYRYFLLENRKVHDVLREEYPPLLGYEIPYEYKEVWEHNINLWCGGYLACEWSDIPESIRHQHQDDFMFELYFDYNDWKLPVDKIKIPKTLEPEIEKKLTRQYKNAIKKKNNNLINDIESKLYDISYVYRKVDQPLHKITFNVHIPSERMYKLKGFTIKKGKVLYYCT